MLLKMNGRFMVNRQSVLAYISIFLYLASACEAPKTSKPDALDYSVPSDGPPGMVWVPGGNFIMGAVPGDEQARPDEYPPHSVKISGFWMDATEVTNEQFAQFIEETGYVTTAEYAPDWNELKKQLPPGTPKPPDSVLVAASMVFTPIETDDLMDWSQWWKWVKGANWRHPRGADTNIRQKEDHPVVQVRWEHAQAYLRL
jgi:formylglycine-generating enzyme required for sulfatase activity